MEIILYILPEVFLSLSMMTLLMIGVFVNKSYRLVNLLAILTMIFAIVLVFNQSTQTIKVFNNSYIIDHLSIYMKILTLLFCLLTQNLAQTLRDTVFSMCLHTLREPCTQHS